VIAVCAEEDPHILEGRLSHSTDHMDDNIRSSYLTHHGGQPILARKSFYNVRVTYLTSLLLKPIATLYQQTSRQPTPASEDDFDELMDESSLPVTESELVLFDMISKAESEKMVDLPVVKVEKSASMPMVNPQTHKTQARPKRTAARREESPVMILPGMRLRTNLAPTTKAPIAIRNAMARRHARVQQDNSGDVAEDKGGNGIRCESAPLSMTAPDPSSAALDRAQSAFPSFQAELSDTGRISTSPVSNNQL
jgi:hypothetical protein